MLLVVLVGTAMDMTPTILILTPVLMPVIKQAGIDPVYFGVLFIINNSIGLITPPVGTVLNVVCGVSKLSMEDLMKGVWPFLLAELAVLALLVLFPELVMVPAKWLAPMTAPADTNEVEQSLGGSTMSRTLTGLIAALSAALLLAPAAQAEIREQHTQVRGGEQQGPSPGHGHGEVRRPRRPRRAAARSRCSCSPAARWAATCRPCRRCRAASSR